MDYKPSDAEKKLAALVQAFSVLVLFVPGIVALRSPRGKRSPYIRYWAKVSIIWSIIVSVLLAGGIIAVVCFHTTALLLAILVVHSVLCVLATMGTLANTPFGYLFVGDMFCLYEMANVWRAPRAKLNEKARKRLAEEAELRKAQEDELEGRYI